jgi:hypothetical protein
MRRIVSVYILFAALVCGANVLPAKSPIHAEAKSEWTPITSIKLNADTNLIVKSQPDLQKRQLSTIYIVIDGKSGDDLEILSFDAEMPEHQHGMMVTPTAPEPVKGQKKPTLRIKGVKLHMPGRWVLKLKVRQGKSIKTYRQDYQVKI